MAFRALSLLLSLGAAVALPVAAAPASSVVKIAYVGVAIQRSLPQAWLDQPAADEGVQGARLAIEDDNTTGRFIGQNFQLSESIAPDAGQAVGAFKDLLAQGQRLFVADLPPAQLDAIADLGRAQGAIIIDATSSDDSLRGADCRVNLLHILPSRAMRADALMQFLSVKRWTRILLAAGPTAGDQAYADAIRRSARKFQIKLAADKPWTYDPGARRTDTGHFAISDESARFTQGIDYDVLVVADESNDFGDDLAFRTTLPRPVAGTQGMVATAWARPFEEWGGTQLQNRFLKLAHRWMTEPDYGAWLAVRSFGEAALRGQSVDPSKIAAYLKGPDFAVAGFKGTELTFRAWDGQLRQPVLLADSRALISVSPQPGFLHETSELDTLGIDQPETSCHAK
jgi:ABC transporter substrate binding protein (PQQ-dependent alcohol dehydrogenase system)